MTPAYKRKFETPGSIAVTVTTVLEQSTAVHAVTHDGRHFVGVYMPDGALFPVTDDVTEQERRELFSGLKIMDLV